MHVRPLARVLMKFIHSLTKCCWASASPRTILRNKLLALAATSSIAAALLSSFALPVAAVAEKLPVTIETSYLDAQRAGDWVIEQIRSFEAAYPQIQVNAQHVSWPGRDEMGIHEIPELPANVLGIDTEKGHELQFLLDRDLIVPIDAFLPDPDFAKEAFFPNLWEPVTLDGKTWAVPYLCSIPAFVCYWPHFERAGISEPPTTWEQLRECAGKLGADLDGDGEFDCWGLRLGWGGWDNHMFFLWSTLALQNGARFFEGGLFALSHPAFRASYDYWRSLADMPGAANDDDRRMSQLIEVEPFPYAMAFVPSYHLPAIHDNKKFRIVEWPAGESGVVRECRSLYLAIGRSTPELERASWELVKWITRKDAGLPRAVREFHVSARVDLVTRDDYRARIASMCPGFELTQELKGRTVSALGSPNGTYEALEKLEVIIGELFAGRIDFDSAMASAELECNAMLRAHTGSVLRAYELYR